MKKTLIGVFALTGILLATGVASAGHGTDTVTEVGVGVRVLFSTDRHSPGAGLSESLLLPAPAASLWSS